MSSSSRNRHLWAAAVAALLGAAAAHSQENYFIPQVSVGADYNTNRDLNPDSSAVSGTETYHAAAEARIGHVTPRSETELHPKLVYQYFEGDTGLNKLDEFLDLRSFYKTLTGRFSFAGQYARQDIVTAELGSATFDEFNPNPTTDDTGLVDVHGTRQTIDVKPGYSVDLNERSNLDAEFEYHAVKYDAVLLDKVGYKSPYFEFTYGHQWGPRSSFSVGPYYSRFESDDDSNKTDTYGAIAQFRRQQTELTNFTLSIRAENDKSTDYLAGVETDSASKATWGIEFVGYRKFLVGGLRYSVGRFLQPSTLGNRRETDQIQLQYTRPISLRFGFTGAVRYSKDNSISADQNSNNDRKRAFADLGFEWQWTQTVFINGGYHYAYQNLQAGDTTASNNAVSLSIIYRGLQPRRVERMR